MGKTKRKHESELNERERLYLNELNNLAVEVEDLFRSGYTLEMMMNKLNITKKQLKSYRKVCQQLDCAIKNSHEMIRGHWMQKLAQMGKGRSSGNPKAIEMILLELDRKKAEDAVKKPAIHEYGLHEGYDHG